MKRSKLSILLAVVLLLCLIPTTALAATVSMANDGGSLYLRSGPGRDYKSVGTVHDGDHISVVTQGGIWSKVKTSSGKTGYIKNLYINDGDKNYAAGTSYFSSYTVYTTAKVNMRAGASTDTKVITSLSKGTKLTALGKNGRFYLVKTSDGSQGYVSSSYISKKSGGNSSSNGSSSSSKKTKTVTASAVNVRAGGGMSYEVLRVLPYGTKITVLKVGNYWTQIQYGSTTGWIKNIYLK